MLCYGGACCAVRSIPATALTAACCASNFCLLYRRPYYDLSPWGRLSESSRLLLHASSKCSACNIFALHLASIGHETAPALRKCKSAETCVSSAGMHSCELCRGQQVAGPPPLEACQPNASCRSANHLQSLCAWPALCRHTQQTPQQLCPAATRESPSSRVIMC